jgi:6-phosphogluconolactonase
LAKSLSDELVVAEDRDGLAHAAGERIAGLVAGAVRARGRCTVALSGGSTPKALFQVLATEYRERAPWGMVEWFWSDERCVPPDHSESNYHWARVLLLAPLRVSFDMTHRIACDRGPAAAATAYDEMLRNRLTGGRFDLVLLGSGPDGHTASLFPGSPALEETTRWAVAVTGGPELAIRERVTLTYPVINRARVIMMLIAGADKRAVLGRILSGDRSLPASRVEPEGTLIRFVDRAALGEGAAA